MPLSFEATPSFMNHPFLPNRPRLFGADFEELIRSELFTAERFDVVINATSASLTESLPAIPVECFASDALGYEMMYGKGRTPFLAFAASAGAQTADGLGMLVEQAAEAFFVWRGVHPSTRGVLDLLRTQIP